MDPRATVIGLANECWVSRCLHAAAIFGFADAIGEEGLTLEDLASKTSAHPRVLRSLLGVLAGRGIFAIANGLVTHTDASRLLRTDHPATVAHIVRWNGSDESWNSFGRLPDVVVSGVSGFEYAFGARLFDHLATSEGAGEIFMKSMEGFTRNQVHSILEAVDFARFQTIVDVGGGTGLLAKSIAERCPGTAVTLFDLPGVVPSAQNDSISVSAGDFFVDPVPPADLIILMNVLHDWRDEEIVDIIASIRRSLNPGGQLFIIEGLIANGKAAIDLLDLGMAVITGGRQRTRAEYETLLTSAGFRIENQIDCSEHLSILVTERGDDYRNR